MNERLFFRNMNGRKALKAIILLLLMGVGYTGCLESYYQVTIKMDVTPDFLEEFPSVGGEKTLTITSTTNRWEVSSSESWLRITNGNGKENGIVTLRADENKGFTPLEAFVTIKGKGFTDIIKAVKIAGVKPNLAVTPAALSFGRTAETQDLKIESNVSWEIIPSATWFTVTPTKGEGNVTVKVAATTNQTTVAREATITVKSEEIPEESTIQVKQEAATFFIEVQSSLEFEASGGSEQIQVNSNISWIVGGPGGSCPDATPCITFTPDRGTNNETVTVVVSPNLETHDRSFEHWFCHVDYESGRPETNFISYFTVTQKGVEPILNVPLDEIFFITSGEIDTFDVFSNTYWIVTSDVSWLTFWSNWEISSDFSSETWGLTGGFVAVAAEPNPTPNERTATIEISCFEGLKRTIKVTQAGVNVIAEPEMVSVPGGTFTMGCTSEQGVDCKPDETPTHQVTVGDFYIGKYEVTQAQWVAVMGTNPSSHQGDDFPVENVSWDDVQKYLVELNKMTGKQYRLPTEEEWEYAARGGSSSRGYKYSGGNTAGDVAWCSFNSGGNTRAVGTSKANELGIYDMSGNVYEWCSDLYVLYDGSEPPRADRVRRGGCYSLSALDARLSCRSYCLPQVSYPTIGFRLAHDRN